MYHWTADMIRFMKDASGYGDYYFRLAERILPYLKNCRHICDAGCGLGELSVRLAPEIPMITAVDIKPQAMAVLRETCRKQEISNIRALEGDINLLPPARPYDGMVFCFFGRSEEILKIAKAQCAGTVAVIKKNYSTHRFSRGEYPTGPDGYHRMMSILEARGIPFRNSDVSLEFGQPFRSFEDVRTFFRCYSRDEDPSVLTDDFLRSRITETGNPEYPFYMPHQRQIGLIFFDAARIQR